MNDLRTTLPRLRLRPIHHDDLHALLAFAEASAHGLTTLPNDLQQLRERIDRSLHSFATNDVSGEESYLFVLEDLAAGRVVGVSGISAQAGQSDRFYSYRNEFVVHRSKPLEYSNRIHTLHLCHDLTGTTVLTSFYVEPKYRDGLAPHLLSRGRLLYIGQHPERFSDRIISENPGLADEAGRCPFWEAVGRRFFNMDYPAVEALAGGRSKSFIADMMPASPVHVPMLSDEAQWAIGQLHPEAELPFSILVDEGFEADGYVDIFDGGPIMVSRPAQLRTITRMSVSRVAQPRLDDRRAAAALRIVANTSRSNFQATLAIVSPTTGGVAVPGGNEADIGLTTGDLTCTSELTVRTKESA